MPEFTEIVRSLPYEKFSEIFAASGRKAREVYFHRHDIKVTASGRGFVKPGAKTEARTQALFELLKEEKDEELCEEVLRVWLLTKRPMLAAALDHLKIPHDNGLTESDDVERFTKLGAAELKALIAHLSTVAPKDDIGVYLQYMGAPVNGSA